MNDPVTIKPFAGPTRRLLAYIIDLATLNIAFLMLYLIFNAIPQIYIEYWQLFLFIFCFYFAVFDSLFLNGQSPGKKLLNINIVDSSGNPISFTKAFIRAFFVAIIYFHNNFEEIFYNLSGNKQSVTIISIVFFSILSILVFGTTIFMIFNPYYQGIHDLVSKSYVVIKEQFKPEHIDKYINISRLLAAYFFTITAIALSIIFVIIYRLYCR